MQLPRHGKYTSEPRRITFFTFFDALDINASVYERRTEPRSETSFGEAG